jgi:predicted MPP superfamily phosphohydrolase
MEEILFAWAHLSDIQYGHGDHATVNEQALILDRLKEDLIQRNSFGAPALDAILVTGDVASTGSRAQYGAAKTWLIDVASAIGLTEKQIYMVPGNHDVDRNAHEEMANRALREALRDGRESIDNALSDTQATAALLARMTPYFELAASGGGGDQPYWVKSFIKGTLHVRIVGLNTALLSAEDGDHGKLAVGNTQINAVCANRDERELVIVLSHHPFSGGWLRDEKTADGWIRSYAHIHLFGHVKDHEAEAARTGAGGLFVRIAASAAHQSPGASAAHGYNVAAIVATADGSLAVRIWPRCWSSGRWHFRQDNDNTQDERPYAQHALRPLLERAPAVRDEHRFEGPSGASATRVPHFVGRDRELADLRVALEVSDQPVCVVADGLGGLGKTALVRQFVATEATRMFDGSVWIDASSFDAEAARAARRFGLHAERRPTVPEAMTFLTHALHDQRILVVIDDVSDSGNELAALPLPGAKSRTILISRAVEIQTSLGRTGQQLSLGRWDIDACRTYLREVPWQHAGATDGELNDLANEVGRAPLALLLLSKLPQTTGKTPRDLLNRLRHQPVLVLEKVATGKDRGLAVSFQTSYDMLAEPDRDVLLALAACAQATDQSTVENVADGLVGRKPHTFREKVDHLRYSRPWMLPSNVRRSLKDLAALSLVDPVDGSSSRWMLHSALRTFVRAQNGVARADAAQVELAENYVKTGLDPNQWQAMEWRMAEVLTAVDRLQVAGQPGDAAALLLRAHERLDEQGRYAELVKRYVSLRVDIRDGHGHGASLTMLV